MEKYELLASVMDAENGMKAQEILDTCKKYRGDNAFNNLYYAVQLYVTEWRIRGAKGGG